METKLLTKLLLTKFKPFLSINGSMIRIWESLPKMKSKSLINCRMMCKISCLPTIYSNHSSQHSALSSDYHATMFYPSNSATSTVGTTSLTEILCFICSQILSLGLKRSIMLFMMNLMNLMKLFSSTKEKFLSVTISTKKRNTAYSIPTDASLADLAVHLIKEQLLYMQLRQTFMAFLLEKINGTNCLKSMMILEMHSATKY